jgi:hypothetical protein
MLHDDGKGMTAIFASSSFSVNTLYPRRSRYLGDQLLFVGLKLGGHTRLFVDNGHRPITQTQTASASPPAQRLLLYPSMSLVANSVCEKRHSRMICELAMTRGHVIQGILS